MSMLETDVKQKFNFLNLPDSEIDFLLQEAMSQVVKRAVERNPGCIEPEQHIEVMFIGATAAASFIELAPLPLPEEAPRQNLVAVPDVVAA